jgi:hypothetical protein
MDAGSRSEGSGAQLDLLLLPGDVAKLGVGLRDEQRSACLHLESRAPTGIARVTVPWRGDVGRFANRAIASRAQRARRASGDREPHAAY